MLFPHPALRATFSRWEKASRVTIVHIRISVYRANAAAIPAKPRMASLAGTLRRPAGGRGRARLVARRDRIHADRRAARLLAALADQSLPASNLAAFAPADSASGRPRRMVGHLHLHAYET